MAKSNPAERRTFCVTCKEGMSWRFRPQGEWIDPDSGEVVSYRRLEKSCGCGQHGVVEIAESHFVTLLNLVETYRGIILKDDTSAMQNIRVAATGPRKSAPARVEDEEPADVAV